MQKVEYIREANAHFLEGVNKICEGQAMDMEFETRDIVSSDEYLKMIEGKTAALLSVSLRLGGMTAGCDTVQLQHLDELGKSIGRSEEHTSELQSRGHLVCRLLLEKKK